MKTPEEIDKLINNFYTSMDYDINLKSRKRLKIKILRIQAEAWNEAVEECAEKAETKEIQKEHFAVGSDPFYTSEKYYLFDIIVDKDSILKLKK